MRSRRWCTLDRRSPLARLRGNPSCRWWCGHQAHHGTNWRAGIVDKPPRKKTFWEKVKYLFFKEDPKEFLVGTHYRIKYLNKTAIKYKTYEKDLYWRAAFKYNIENIVRQIAESNIKPDGSLPNVVMYGEIIGPKIQTGYDYGIEKGDFEIRVFDIMIDNKFINWESVKHLCDCFNLPVVKEVYVGPWRDDIPKLAEGVDEFNGKKYTREGVVTRPLEEKWSPRCGRVIMKTINPAYLLDKKNSENH